MAITAISARPSSGVLMTPLGVRYPEWVYNLALEYIGVNVLDVTPQLAERWLTANLNNRTLRPPRVALMAEIMGKGGWFSNGESISFDSEGILVDGQHRLAAGVASGLSWSDVIVVRGVNPNVRPAVDTGLKRTAGDNLTMRGEQYASQMAATLQIWFSFYEGFLRRNDTFRARMSHQEVIEWLELWPGIRESVLFAGKLGSGHRRALAPAEAAFTHFAIKESGRATREQADEFLRACLEGINLEPGNPVLALRQRLMDERMGFRNRDKRGRLALVLKAWVLYRDGKQRKLLKFLNNEPFPDIG